MFKIIRKILILSILCIYPFSNLYADKKIIESLKQGEKIIFIRHAIAPGSGDPENFSIDKCETQRNLSKEGIEQSKNIGSFFSRNKIPIDKVLSSEWCRCKDTAKYAFKKHETFDALNSFFSSRFHHNKKSQMNNLFKYLNNWDGKKNLVLVTHYVVILETLDKAVSSGEIIVTDKNLKLIGSISNY